MSVLWKELSKDLYSLEGKGYELEVVCQTTNSEIVGIHLGDSEKRGKIFIIGCQHGDEYQSAKGLLEFCKRYKREEHIFVIPVVDVENYGMKEPSKFFERDINSLYPSKIQITKEIFSRAKEYELIVDTHINTGSWGFGFVCCEHIPLNKPKIELGKVVVKTVKKYGIRVLDTHILSKYPKRDEGIVYNDISPCTLTYEIWKIGKYAIDLEFPIYTDKPGSRHGRRINDRLYRKMICDVLLSLSEKYINNTMRK